MKKLSLWLDTSAPPDFPKLQGRVAADVVVVGGGITGLTTAYLLKKIGCRVAVVDQRSIGGGETAHTTAHITFVTDIRLHELASRLGERQAQALWGAPLIPLLGTTSHVLTYAEWMAGSLSICMQLGPMSISLALIAFLS